MVLSPRICTRQPPPPAGPPTFPPRSLQILLHKNLMRLRQFMASPDMPIPDAPKDWMPPMPRSDTPPPEESDDGSDSANEVRAYTAVSETNRDAISVGVVLRRWCCVQAVQCSTAQLQVSFWCWVVSPLETFLARDFLSFRFCKLCSCVHTRAARRDARVFHGFVSVLSSR